MTIKVSKTLNLFFWIVTFKNLLSFLSSCNSQNNYHTNFHNHFFFNNSYITFFKNCIPCRYWLYTTYVPIYTISVLGFLSTLSCESSVLILTLVTWDRFISVTQPLVRKQPSKKVAVITLITLWSFSTVISLAPLSDITRGYFGDEFYGNNGVCLSLHIHEPYAMVRLLFSKKKLYCNISICLL